jgi:hypothetical protein
MTTSARWVRKLLGFDRPAITLDEDRHADLRERCIADVRAQVEHAGTDLDVLGQQASDDYREQDRRADRAERRASSIGTAGATLLGLTITGGGLLITAGFTQSAAHRTVVMVLTTLVVATLVLAGDHALATQTTHHEWARPHAARYLTARAGLGDDVHLETVGALMAAALHNATIADWKYHHLERAAKTFGVGLASFVVAPLILFLGAVLGGA